MKRQDARTVGARLMIWVPDGQMVISRMSTALVGLLLYVYILLRTAWLCDDAYITLRTVGNFVSGYGLTWNTAERVQAYTHPLWMFLLSGVFCLTADTYYSCIIMSMVLAIAAVTIVTFGIARTKLQAIFGLVLFILSKAFVDYSTSGLENPLTYLLLAGFFALYLSDHPVTPNRLSVLSLIACLGALNRLDTLLLFGPALLESVWSSQEGATANPTHSEASNRNTSNLIHHRLLLLIQRMGLVLIGFLPFVAWEVFSIIYYGFPFPNTAYAKLNTGIPAGELLRQGLCYVLNSLVNDRVTLPAIGIAVVVSFAARHIKHVAIAVGMLLYLIYVVRIGGDFMSGRYLAAPLLCGAAILSSLTVRNRMAIPVWYTGIALASILGLMTPHPPLLAGSRYRPVGCELIDNHGIADERGCYYIFTGMLRSNRQAVPHWVRGDAESCRKGSGAVVTCNTIGLLGYHAGPDIHIVDLFALTDPLLARLPAKPVARWRIGHFAREIPAGYVETLDSGHNQIRDAHIRELYDNLVLITRGAMFTRERWRAIWEMNVGR